MNFNRLPLYVYPLLQTLLMGLAGYLWETQQNSLAFVCALFAGMTGTWTLFVSIHEMVHSHFLSKGLLRQIGEVFFTFLIGQPYNGYRASHFAHHHYVNSLDDETSTYRRSATGPKPQSVWRYTLLWPLQFIESLLRKPSADSYLYKMRKKFQAGFLKDLFFLSLFVFGIAEYNSTLLGFYFLMCYIAWAGMALLNYAQHPPIEYGTELTTSYYGKVYNLLFYRNGYHFEHHQNMQGDPLNTEPKKGALVIREIPPLAPFVRGSFAHNDSPKC